MRTKETVKSADMRKKYYPEYDPNDEYRPVKWQHFMSPIPKYRINRSGLVIGPSGRPLLWKANKPERGEGSSPSVNLSRVLPEGKNKPLQVHRGVAYTFYEELQWDMDDSFIEEFEKCSPFIQKLLLDSVFHVDHHDGIRWNPHISNLRLMLPMDNYEKSYPKLLRAVRERHNLLDKNGLDPNVKNYEQLQASLLGDNNIGK